MNMINIMFQRWDIFECIFLDTLYTFSTISMHNLVLYVNWMCYLHSIHMIYFRMCILQSSEHAPMRNVL